MAFGQDFMLQGWYWDYDKDGCNGYSGPNWADRLNDQVTTLGEAGITHVWLPPMSRASFGACSNGYDPKDLYDLGEYGLGRTGFGTRAEVDALIASLTQGGMEAVADVVYNHRDGGAPEDNPAVKAYVETNYDGGGEQPFPSDRFRNRLPLGGTYGAGDYYIKISSKTQNFGPNRYKFYATVAGVDQPFQGRIDETEPNGGGDCGQPFDDVQLDQDLIANLYDFSGCYTDEFKLTITDNDFLASGDDLLISLTNFESGYSDHRIYDIYYQPTNGNGFNVNLADLKYETYTDFTQLPSAQGGMNFENFRPNSTNTNTTGLNGDEESLLFFYDVVQANPSSRQVYADWSKWLMNSVGIGGLRMDAVKHFPPSFVGQILDDLHDNNLTPGMVVGEFFDGDANKLAGWVNAVNASKTKSQAAVKVFDFTLREALKQACDNGGFDVREVYNRSLRDATNLTGFNVVTFVNNHDFRGPGEAVMNDPLLAYAYIMTNNQLGVPSIFYPDFFGTELPNAPQIDLSEELTQLMSIHQQYIVNATSVDYLNRFGTPYTATYNSGVSNQAMVYQLRGAPGAAEVIVAINFNDVPLDIQQTIPGVSQFGAPLFTEVTGNAPTSTVVAEGDQFQINVPAKSYAIYALTAEDVVFNAEAGTWHATIQDAVDQADSNLATDLYVRPGAYDEAVDYSAKNIHVHIGFPPTDETGDTEE
ncbi:hypothetical protein A3850_018770 [Lewinella sp. 4G2]|nr:hypothetical protein A3850_018770 [Lewinella sp. 4G2]